MAYAPPPQQMTTIRRPIPDGTPQSAATPRSYIVRDRPDQGFDVRDRAPEDRLHDLNIRNLDFGQSVFGPYEAIVRGTLHIEGVNYAKYEAQKHRPNFIAAFLDALRDDVISEVGNGVHREDILLNLYPGAIKTVVLHYDRNGPDSKPTTDPRLVDAEWSVKCDYAIRARDVQRQQNIAVALFTALGEEKMFSCARMTKIYMQHFDPNVDEANVAIVRPVLDNPERAQIQQQPVPRSFPAPAAYDSPARAPIPAPAPLVQPQPVYAMPMAQPGPIPAPQSMYPTPAAAPSAQVSSYLPTNAMPSRPMPPAPSAAATGTATVGKGITPVRAGVVPAPPAPYSSAHTLAPQTPRAASPEVFQRQPMAQQTPQPVLDASQGASMLNPSAVPIGEGWTEYKGRRGLTVFIPEDALYQKPTPSVGHPSPYSSHAP